jgi:hypothetical protein
MRPAKLVGAGAKPSPNGAALCPLFREEAAGEGWPGGMPMGVSLDVADAICANRMTLFDLVDCPLGPQINWNYEYKACKSAPMGYAPGVDYRDPAVTGDCKFVWELNRHLHLVVLGRAYRATGHVKYARSIVRHLTSWMDQCPYGLGMNWRSTLELAIRLINWCWALEMIRPSGLVAGPFFERLLTFVYRHIWEIDRHYTRFSSANNHLIGEAAGVFIASSYFCFLKRASHWRDRSRAILSREILGQTYADGGSREQAIGYHLFVLEFLLLSGLTARNTGLDFPPDYWRRLERMFEFVSVLAEGGNLPSFGDCDDGYVIELGNRSARVRELLGIGAALFGRKDFKVVARSFDESGWWLLGQRGATAFEALPSPETAKPLTSRALSESGYYLLQSGLRGKDALSVVMDCGELGLGSIAAHGHADALSFTLRAFGADVLMDPGTYDYFTYPQWRAYFRSTRAHNTIMVDECNQSQVLGAFLWGERANAHCVRWAPAPGGGIVVGEHDGYRRLPGSVLHRRTLRLEGPELSVVDELVGAGEHAAEFLLHFSEECNVRAVSGNDYIAEFCGGRMEMAIAGPLHVRLVRGETNPILGWVSRGYHRKSSAFTLTARCTWQDRIEFKTRFVVKRVESHPEPLEAISSGTGETASARL